MTAIIQCKGYILASAHCSSINPNTPISPSYFLISSPMTQKDTGIGNGTGIGNEGEHPGPYAIIPCPCEVSVPPVLSEGCKGSKGNRACWRLNYCEKHWCGPCKKASKLEKQIQVGQEQESKE